MVPGTIGNSPMIVRVVAAFIAEGDKVFVQQRPAHKARGGLWEFPGGKVDPGETDDAALVREISEELGITIVVDEKYAETEQAYGDLTIHLVVYRARRCDRDEPLMIRDAQQVRWHDVSCLGALELCEADRKAIALADDRQ